MYFSVLQYKYGKSLLPVAAVLGSRNRHRASLPQQCRFTQVWISTAVSRNSWQRPYGTRGHVGVMTAKR